MKKSIIYSIMMGMIMVCSFSTNAQDDKKPQKPQFNHEQMTQRRAQAMADKLELDDATTAKFVETYKAYLKETHEVYAKYGPKHNPKDMKKKDKQRKTDAEVEQEIMNQFAMSRALVDVREKYYKKFRTFLNPRQIKKVYAEEREKADRMKWEKDRRDGKGPRMGNDRGKGKGKGPRMEMHGQNPGKTNAPAKE